MLTVILKKNGSPSLDQELERSQTDRSKNKRTVNFAKGYDVIVQINSRELSSGVTTGMRRGFAL